NRELRGPDGGPHPFAWCDDAGCRTAYRHAVADAHHGDVGAPVAIERYQNRPVRAVVRSGDPMTDLVLDFESVALWAVAAGTGLAVALMLAVVIERIALAAYDARLRRIARHYGPLI